jgi:hypothetical protein
VVQQLLVIRDREPGGPVNVMKAMRNLKRKGVAREHQAPALRPQASHSAGSTVCAGVSGAAVCADQKRAVS